MTILWDRPIFTRCSANEKVIYGTADQHAGPLLSRAVQWPLYGVSRCFTLMIPSVLDIKRPDLQPFQALAQVKMRLAPKESMTPSVRKAARSRGSMLDVPLLAGRQSRRSLAGHSP